MPFSSVVVNRPWDAAIDSQLRPAPHPDVAQVVVDDVVVVTHPAAELALAFDPLSSVLWGSFDGETSLEALAADLVDSIDVSPEEAATQLDGMCRWLGWRGFLVEPHVPEALRYDWFPALDDDACPAQKMGLADAALIDLDLGLARVRLGSTDDLVVDQLRRGYADRVVAADPADEREIICANVGTPSGTTRPRHRVVDHWGNLLYTGRSRAAAATTLVRLVDDRLAQLDGGTWLRTPVLVGDGRAVLVHRGVEDILDRALPRLERDGIRLFESPYGRIDATTGELVVADPSITIAPDDESAAATDAPFARGRVTGVTPSGRLPIHGIVIGPGELPRYEVVRALSQTATRWDQVHLDAVHALAARVPAVGLGDDLSATAAARSFRRAFDVA